MGRKRKVGRKRKLTQKQYQKNQIENSNKWNKEHTTAISIRLVNGRDDDIKSHLASVDSKTTYIKTLIRKDINNNK